MLTSRDFCYWLQGFFELAMPSGVTTEQAAQIKKHLGLVFLHEIDPSVGDAAHQAKLNDAHHVPPTHEPAPGGEGPGGTIYRC